MTRVYALLFAVLLLLSLLAPLARPAPSGSTDVRSKTVYHVERLNSAIVDPNGRFPKGVSARVENVDITRSGYLDVAANEGDSVFVELYVQADVEVGARAHFQPGVGYYPGVATVHWELVHKAWRVELSYSFAGRNGSLAAERPPGLPDESRSGTVTAAASLTQPAYTGHDTPDTRQDNETYTAAQNSTRLYYTIHVHIEKLYALTQLLAATNKTGISATATLTATLTVKVTHNNARTNLWNLKPLLKYSCVRNGGGAQGLHAVVLE